MSNTQTASLADYRFRATFSPAGKTVRFAGPGGFYDAALLKGALGGQIGFGFSLLAKPSGLLGRLRRSKWEVAAPRRSTYPPGMAATRDKAGLYNNKGELRRILIIEGPEVAVLRFNRPIPRGLIFALKTAFTGTLYPAWFATGDVGRVQSRDDDDDPNDETEESDGPGQEDREQDQPSSPVGL